MKGKAAVLVGVGGPFEIREYPLPELETGAILAKISMTSICGSDIHIYKGDRAAFIASKENPKLFGHEAVGTVYRLGSELKTDYMGNPLKEGDRIIGNRTKLKVVKNKMAPPFKVAEFDIIYGEGISREGDILDLGIGEKIVQKSGSWFSYGDIRIGQGRENARDFLKENDDIRQDVELKIRSSLGLVRTEAAAESGTGESS